jgi:uncharacterized repeat protein (TIGR03803 family)
MKTLSFAKASCLLFGSCLVLGIQAPAQTFTVLQNFAESDPTSALVQGVDGNLYGTMGGGEIGFEGNVYTLTPSGSYTSIAEPCCSSYAPVVLASNGYFYGSTQQGGTALEGSIYRMTAEGVVGTLHSFCTTPSCLDGSDPQGPLVQLGNGDLYGTTTSTIFKITLAGELTTLYNFCNPTCASAWSPSGLTLASDGNFYGVANGGANVNGTVFKMTPSGTLTTLHSFDLTDGSIPVGPLVQATNGYLYGVTLSGGTGVNRACAYIGSGLCGTIFKISTSGTFTTVHEFAGRDGANPDAGLVLASDGNLYGTTYAGGNNSNNAGTVFVISPASGALATLYDFCSQTYCLDGGNPFMPLLQATNGVLYGTTRFGGTQTNGIFFSLSRGLRPFVQTIPAQGNAGTNVLILGNGLTGATNVTFRGVPAAFNVVSDTEITATVPTGAATGAVVVTTPSASLASDVAFRIGH